MVTKYSSSILHQEYCCLHTEWAEMYRFDAVYKCKSFVTTRHTHTHKATNSQKVTVHRSKTSEKVHIKIDESWTHLYTSQIPFFRSFDAKYASSVRFFNQIHIAVNVCVCHSTSLFVLIFLAYFFLCIQHNNDILVHCCYSLSL